MFHDDIKAVNKSAAIDSFINSLSTIYPSTILLAMVRKDSSTPKPVFCAPFITVQPFAIVRRPWRRQSPIHRLSPIC